MDLHQTLVAHFMRTHGQPVATKPTLIPRERVQLRVRLVAEELQEYATAAGLNLKVIIVEEHHTPTTPDLVQVVDGLTDLLYVVLGSAVEHGVDLERPFIAVHFSNMTKDGPPDPGGKVTKGPNYRPPDLSSVLSVLLAD